MAAAISIHALREEGDAAALILVPAAIDFYPRPPRGGRHRRDAKAPGRKSISIHALREEGDVLPAPEEPPIIPNFYPRPPRGGRLSKLSSSAVLGVDFYPRPPRGGRPVDTSPKNTTTDISIHALREEGDLADQVTYRGITEFLSTPSARRATRYQHTRPTVGCNFYPRPPRGGRRRNP